MDCIANQESKPTVAAADTSLSFLVESNASSSHSSLGNALPTANQAMAEIDHIGAPALPLRIRGILPKAGLKHDLEACTLPLFSSVLHQTADAQSINPSMIHFGCPSLMPHPGAHLYTHTMYKSQCDVDAAHTRFPKYCMPQEASASRLEFMHSFVSTLVPQLRKIHSQSPSMSLKQKLSAVRCAANMSLAISAGGNKIWSKALFQESARSCGCKMGLKRKYNGTKPSNFRGKIYASVLRKRSSLRGGGYVARLKCQPHTSHVKGSSSPSRLDLSGCRIRCRMRRVGLKRQSRRFSYVKILRNSGPRKPLQATTVLCKEVGKSFASSISKEDIASLGRLVPGGCNMDVPLLFQEASDYIISLQMQVEALQSLSHFVS